MSRQVLGSVMVAGSTETEVKTLRSGQGGVKVNQQGTCTNACASGSPAGESGMEAQGEVPGPQDLGAPQLQAGQRAPPPRLEGEEAPVGTVFTQGRARPVCPRWGHVPSPLARRSWRSVPLIKLGSSRSGPHGGSCRPPGPMDPAQGTEARALVCARGTGMCTGVSQGAEGVGSSY